MSWTLACAPGSTTAVSSASATLYTRVDSNATTVWSPRTNVAGKVGDALNVHASYGLDAWTGASIDVVTAATAAIHEVRHELNGGASYELDDVAVSGAYRYSTEPDYESHGGTGTVRLDLAQHNSTLELTVLGNRDQVGRAGDPLFAERQSSVGGRLAVTQVLDLKTLAQLSWETSYVRGYQASPYRFVALGGDGTCAGGAPLCLPEHMPQERRRHALSLRLRRALGDTTSFGLQYRFYFDDWGVQSQALSPELGWLLGEPGHLTLSYRYYTQREASFFRPRYLDVALQDGYFTRDRELSALYSHRLGLGYRHTLPFERSRAVLSLALRAAGTYYRYLAFVGLREVFALELTALLGVDFP